MIDQKDWQTFVWDQRTTVGTKFRVSFGSAVKSTSNTSKIYLSKSKSMEAAFVIVIRQPSYAVLLWSYIIPSSFDLNYLN